MKKLEIDRESRLFAKLKKVSPFGSWVLGVTYGTTIGHVYSKEQGIVQMPVPEIRCGWIGLFDAAATLHVVMMSAMFTPVS